MAKTLYAPTGTTEASFAGERYPVAADGTITVPDHAAEVFMHSHGFAISPDKTRVIGVKAALDTDLVEDDENDAPSASDFSRPMTQQDMKGYLRSQGVGIPKGITVGELRHLVEETYTAQLAAHQAEQKAAEALANANKES